MRGLHGFDAASLLTAAAGQPLWLPMERIQPDPHNLRTRFDPQALRSLARSIDSVGLIQPITVRSDRERTGYYLICQGERRFRAVQSLGHDRIRAFIDEHFDPYAQAIENIQREDVPLLDLARWMAGREAAGDSRATIARKLGLKGPSFVTEAIELARAPEPIVQAYEAGRIPDARTAYRLSRAYREQPATVEALLQGDAPLSRATVTARLQAATPSGTHPSRGSKKRSQSAGWPPVQVSVAGRVGQFLGERGATSEEALVHFEGEQVTAVPLKALELVRWLPS